MSKLREAWDRLCMDNAGFIPYGATAIDAAITDAEAEIARLRQMLREWEEHAGPFKDAEIARLTRERDEARAKLREIGNLFGAKPASLGEKALRLVLQRIRDEAGAILKGDSHD